MASVYTGVIIEESLENKEVLKSVRIVKTDIERVTDTHKTPWVKQWTMHTVEIPDSDAEGIARVLSRSLDSRHEWYADFKNAKTHFIIFRDKVFRIERASPAQYQDVVNYGISLGIPAHQLDF